jgi:hypothetical protein
MAPTPVPDGGLDPGAAPILDAAEVVPGLCRLVRRPGALDGSLPMRAVQYCPPVVQGSAAGFQVALAQPITLRRDRTGVVVALTEGGADRLRREVRAARGWMAARGWLSRAAPWLRPLGDGAFSVRADRLLVWTGWLVRPAAGTVLLVSGAYNRRSRVPVREHVITDTERFTPLVLEIELRGLTARPAWLEGELGCVTPLAPRVRFLVRPLAAAPEVGAFVPRFFDAAYFAAKATGPTGCYRRLQAGLDGREVPGGGDHQLAYLGPAVHRVAGRWRCAGPDGWSTWTGSSEQVLQQAIVGSDARLEAHWDGHAMRVFRPGSTGSRERFDRLWRQVYGLGAERARESFRAGFVKTPLDEPHLGIAPPVFVASPPGWSSIVDGFHGAAHDGMRGVVATDAFGGVPTVYRFHRPGRLRIPEGGPLLRVLPVPRAMLRRPLRQVDVEAGPPAPTGLACPRDSRLPGEPACGIATARHEAGDHTRRWP